MPTEASPLSPPANGSRVASLAARVRALPSSAWLLLAANVVPLVGVLAFGWDLGTIMALFWAENAIIGVYAILKIALVARWVGLFLVPFFTVHYGIFTAAHGIFVFTLFVDAPLAATIATMLPAVLALVVSHGASFFTNFVRGGQMQSLRDGNMPRSPSSFPNAGALMAAPYRRVVVLHLTILGGGFLLLLLGAPVYALVLLVVLKTIVDLATHLRERAKNAAPTPAAAPATFQPRP